MWIVLVMLLSLLMIQAGRDASDNIWIEGKPTFRYYVALSWEILKGVAAVLPVWLLSLLGLARSFLGETWLPIAQKIPVRVTKIVAAVSATLMVGVTVVSAVCTECFEAPYRIQNAMKTNLEGWQTAFAWILFYSIVLYVEQRCILRKYSKLHTRKVQAWVTAASVLTLIIALELSCVALWYIPLGHVDSPNTLEDYYLWWSALYSAVFILPLWFFCVRKAVRLFRNEEQWLALSNIIPERLTLGIVLLLMGMMARQVQQCRSCSAWLPHCEVPEYAEAAVMAHRYQAMMWGLALFYMVCLLVKQLRAVCRAKRKR